MTLADLIRSSNLTIIRQILNSTGNITVYINGTRVGLESRLSDILKKLSPNVVIPSTTSITMPSSIPPTVSAFVLAGGVGAPVVVMAIIVLIFGILLYKRTREKNKWYYR
jgi:hypothetical protein